MAKETVEAVKKAEKEAKNIIESAKKKYGEILEDAGRQQNEIISAAGLNAKNNSKNYAVGAEKDAAKIRSDITAQGQAIADDLRKTAEAAKDAAVEEILREILN